MARKLQPGDAVAVSTKNGKGSGRFMGYDDRSGMPIVQFEKLKVDDGKESQKLDGAQVYVPRKDLRRD
jgi:hypothetical protein